MTRESATTNCYAATDIAIHLRQLAAYVTPEVEGELVESKIILAEVKSIYAKAERQWMVLASIDREIAYQQETARRHNFPGLVVTLQELRGKLADHMSA